MAASKNRKKAEADERREVQRHGAELSLRFRVVNGDTGRRTKEIPGAVKNLSETGFCLTTDLTVIEDLHVLASSSGVSRNTLDIKMYLANNDEISIQGFACWYNLSKPGDPYRYEVGIQIEKISEEDRLSLRDFVRQKRRKKFYNDFLPMKWIGPIFGGE